ncbi:MAG: NAD(P)-binding protein [Gemmataceae bacterium]|nr:NAD(P)-binding protein [Gemmataceae bacterium]
MRVDVAILGGGFSGAILGAMLARRGRSVAVLEKGRHPRFALGESSTPMSNYHLQAIAEDCDLPALAPLSKYGPWTKAYPNLDRGLKRGFTFACHRPGEPFRREGNEMLVTANPTDEAGDTHWLRADFDQFAFQVARDAGVHCHEGLGEIRIERGPPWRFVSDGGEIEAPFAVDATGPAAAVGHAAGSTPTAPMRTDSWSVYSHVVGLRRWEDVQGGCPDHPYRCDDAALHHILADGWIYVLRFDSGVTSAGVLVDGTKRSPSSCSPEEEWRAMLGRYPSVAEHFDGSEAIRPWVRTPRLQRRMSRLAGPDWALLAPSAYTLDALYSTGNAHALTTVRRLARLLVRRWDAERYAAALGREIDFLDTLVHGSYRAFGDPRRLFAWTMLYFAGAITAEETARAGKATPEDEFLSSHIPAFRAEVMRLHEAVIGPTATPDFEADVRRSIAPWNSVGLCDPGKRNLYPW